MASRRARMRSIVMINWRNCFYWRYELAPLVTGLEGLNGAGKTTVMIAAYCALLPDLHFLRFTNLGESTSSADRDRGIGGRLGDPGPAYALLELSGADGSRLLAGVQIERKTASDVELHPFLVEGVDEARPLHEILLFRDDRGHDNALDLDELKAQVARLGGQLRPLDAQAYFGELFDRGILPLRLGSQEERKRFNQMLRTSMTGGISHSLQTGLRDYLLREDRGLSETVQRMREVLESCRRTRRAVADNRRLHATLRDVWNAGHGTFAAAIHAARLQAEERRATSEESRRSAVAARAVCDEHAQRVASIVLRHEDVARRLGEAEQEREAVEEERSRRVRAEDLLRRIEAKRVEHEEAGRAHDRAKAAQEAATGERDRAMADRDRWAGRQLEIARQLAAIAEAYRDIAAKVGRYREARDALAAVRSSHGELVGPADLPALMTSSEASWSNACRAVEDVEDMLRTADARAAAFAEPYAALQRLSGRSVPPPDAARAADEILARLERLYVLAGQLGELSRQLVDATRWARQAADARARAQQLSAATAIVTSDDVRREHQTAQRAAEDAAASVTTRNAEREGAQARVESLAEELASLETAVAAWDVVHARASELGSGWDVAVRTHAGLEALRRTADHERARHAEAARSSEEALEDVYEQIAALRAGGDFPESLRSLRDALDGVLLADRWEEVSIDEARRVEARLGPLHHAILVADVGKAAAQAAALPDRPDTVWLLESDATIPPGDEVADSMLVSSGGAGRLTRLPRNPVVGRAAREARIQTLRARAGELTTVVERERHGEQRCGAALDTIAWLQARVGVLEAPDPRVRQAHAAEELLTCRAEAETLGRSLAEARALAADATRRRDRLAALLPDGWLLDPPDREAALRLLSERVTGANAARDEVTRSEADREVLKRLRHRLAGVPLTDEERATLGMRMDRAVEGREALREPRRRLRYLAERVDDLQWAHLEPVLEEKMSARTALEGELDASTEPLESARREVEALEDVVASKRNDVAECYATLSAVAAALRSLWGELAELNVPDPTAEALSACLSRLADANRRRDSLRDEERKLDKEVAVEASKQEALARRAEECGTAADEAERQYAPFRDAWERLHTRAAEAGLLAEVLTEEVLRGFAGQPGTTLRGVTSDRRRHLLERLHAAEGAAELAARLAADTTTDDLETWQAVRGWLQERIPRHIIQTDQPREAMDRLAEELRRLDSKLLDLEEHLKTRTQGIANAIRSRLARELRNIQRLNAHLRDVRFGSIEGIQIQSERVGRMERLLDVLCGRNDLFSGETPFEEGLEAAFKEIGGGKVQADQLLDYRQYVQLHAQIFREGRWSPADSNKMSTGEAIGVGAAVMMVILSSWEQAAAALTGRRTGGTLRFLFLDEATRLSTDSLAVVFDLCRRLDLQMLIAAPEVAHASGTIVHTLVRTKDEHGRDVVRVNGRRLVEAAS
jgi:chromosome partition protein MukB